MPDEIASVTKTTTNKISITNIHVKYLGCSSVLNDFLYD
jgi:hypothetical protein